MPTLTAIFLLLIATVLLCIVPGPDMLYVIARSTGQGRYAGVISCVGIATGGLLQTTAVALLASLLGIWLRQHTGVAKVIRWLTGGVFIGLGVRLAFSQRQ